MRFDKEEVFEVSLPCSLLELSVDQEQENEENVHPPDDDHLPEEEQEEDVDDDSEEHVDESESEEHQDMNDESEEEEEEEEEEEDVNDEVSEGEDGEDREEEEEEEEVEEQADEEEGEEEEEPSSTLVPTTAHASPYLVFHHGKRNSKQTFYSISEDNYSVRSVPDMSGMTCCASSHGWLVMLDNFSDQCFLLNPVSMEKIQLPPIKITSSYRKADYCVLTSSPPDCVVMFVSSDHVSCLFCQPDDQNWTRKALGPSWKNGSKSSFNYISAVGSCNGKIYIVYWFGAAIKVLNITKDDQDHTDETTTDNHTDDLINEDTRRNNPTTFRVLEKIKIENENKPLLQKFNNITTMLSHLVESCGEVYMVIKIYWGGSGHNEDIYNLEVYKLNSSSSSNGGPAWNKVESLGGDRLFFLGNGCSLSFPASKIGMKENYIFFFEPEDECLYSYNMEDQSISIDLPCPNIVHPKTQPYWMLPIV